MTMNFDPESLAQAVRSGKRRALAQAITLIESVHPQHRPLAASLLERLAPYSGKALRLGISGVPGVGKSTFIERFGLHVVAAGHRLAVLSVDPSSARSGGSILGDKTRMQDLSRHPQAFIRPSPAGGTLGGVARRTREDMLLCEAAGHDVVIIETVGVGQSETTVADLVDMFLLLVLPGGGDELQGIKRGITELADLVLVNKADGESLPAAQRTAADYRLALSLLQPRSRSWRTPVELCSALTGAGIAQTWETVCRYRDLMSHNGELSARRTEQARRWLWSEIAEILLEEFRSCPAIHAMLPIIEAEVMAGALPPTVAARKLAGAYFLKG